jgi:iron complex outermembrane recepter protein
MSFRLDLNSEIKVREQVKNMQTNNVDRKNSLVHSAVRFAMLGGAAAAAMPTLSIAQEGANDLDEVLVTGSRIRRVDAENANPVQVVTAEAIKESGAATIGELMQKLPSIGGAATNPATNNGGGDGASNIELRGLGVERTLVLINGRRFGALGDTTSAIDVNAIPVNMIERVEVLKQGAGAIYGSDAIGGVVNFITRTSFDGAEVGVDYGQSSRSDGKRKGINFTYGHSGDRGSLMLGLNYNQQDSISAGDRAFSRNAIYFYGSVFEGGSSRVPTGRMFLPAGLLAQYGGAGCTSGSVTRREGASGASLANYRCFINSGSPNDFYNYQPENLILTPQDRVSIFTLGNFDLNDNIELYSEFLYNYTTSGFKIAPLPFDSRADDIVISAQNIYNPFGISFGGADGVNQNATWRMLALGNRRNEISSYQGQVNLGARGQIMASSWNYDLTGGYGRMDQETTTRGYLFSSRLRNAVGPSFNGPNGPTCGTVAAPIPGCIPLNIFNLTDPSQVAALSQIAGDYNQSYAYSIKSLSLALNGDLFEMPAGTAKLATGFEYREQASEFDTDFVTQAEPPLFLNCLLGQEPCSGDRAGGFKVKELYGELLLPLLTGAPAAKSLNLIIGGRYSDYTTYGSSTNGTYKLEWRPLGDLLVRASYADVFRAPTILDLYQAPTADAPTFTDPCIGLTQARVTANPNLALACVNVPRNGTFQQPNGQITGLRTGNTALDAEDGDALTVGFVYDPSWLNGATLSVDYWRYKLNNVIQLADVNTSATICVQTGDPFFCGLHTRFADGTTQVFREPRVNLGTLELNGFDISAAYRFDTTVAGKWRVSLDTTITDKYDNVTLPGTPATQVAGYYDRQYGNIAKLRMTGQIGWSMGDFTALAVARYIDKIKLSDPDGAPGTQPDLNIKAATYVDLTVGYTIPTIGSKLQIGVNNLTDKQPPILYQNNVINANTDVSTYDTIGRYFYMNLSHKF